MCGARRRPPYCTKMTRDMGTSSNALRITWFGQRHLTSTLRPIITHLTDPLAPGSGVAQVRALTVTEPR